MNNIFYYSVKFAYMSFLVLNLNFVLYGIDSGSYPIHAIYSTMNTTTITNHSTSAANHAGGISSHVGVYQYNFVDFSEVSTDTLVSAVISVERYRKALIAKKISQILILSNTLSVSFNDIKFTLQHVIRNNS